MRFVLKLVFGIICPSKVDLMALVENVKKVVILTIVIHLRAANCLTLAKIG